MPPFRTVLAIAVLVILAVGALEWLTLGWAIGPPLVAAVFFAVLWKLAPTWPRASAVLLLPFCFIAPAGAWDAFLGGEHGVVLIPLFDTLFAGFLLVNAALALRAGA